MAHRRGPTTVATRKSTVRTSLNTQRRHLGTGFRRSLPTPVESESNQSPSDISEDDSDARKRTVLAPVHPNVRLRKLPGRMFQAVKNSVKTAIGGKRKRGGENSRTVAGRAKRRKREPEPLEESESESEPDASEMEVDDTPQPPRWHSDDENDDSSDEHMLHYATAKELTRLRKEELIRLFNVAQLIGDADTMTKPDIVSALVSAREDTIDLPPSSPRAESSDDAEAEDGNVAGGEETDFAPSKTHYPNGPPGLRRRATVAFDSGEAEKDSREPSRKRVNHMARSASMGNVENTWAGPSSATSPPPAARTRSRKLSGGTAKLLPPVQLSTRKRNKVRLAGIPDIAGGESELTDLTESEDAEHGVLPSRGVPKGQPSPRRTRSRSQTLSMIIDDDVIPEAEEETDEPEVDGDDDYEDDEPQALPETPKRTKTSTERRTPLKSRLRPRRTQTFTPPSDGDGDGDDEADAEAETDLEVEEGDGEEEDGLIYDPTPRKLRSGRIVGEDTVAELSEESDTSVEAPEAEPSDEDQDEDVEIDEPEANEDDDTDDIDPEAFDLHNASIKTLLRLRRADLVHMCAARELDMIGTKPQLSKRLIEWRNTIESAQPNSTGTVREAPATIRPPVLLRSHIHVNGPCTPPLSPAEAEIELDLESLGLEDREIPPDRLTKLDKIGSGGFKDVFVGKWRSKRVAISEFRGTLGAMDIKELKLLGGFDHPNIVRFLGVSIPENTRDTPVMMISELCSNGDLFDYVRNVKPPSPNKVFGLMLDIAHGLEYLHLRKPSVIHRDCKSSNILITGRGVAKIADFGLAKVKQSTRSMVRSLVGTVNWQAPELWHAHPKYNHKVDVWSCAMVYWEMLQWYAKEKKFPWEGMNEHAIYEIVGVKHQRPPIAGLRKLWGNEIVDLVQRMWAQEHEDRPTMSEVVKSLQKILRR